MNIPFSQLSWSEQARVANEWDRNHGSDFQVAESDMVMNEQNTKLAIVAALKEFGIILPDSIRLSGPGLTTLLGAVQSAALARRMYAQDEPDDERELNELAGVQMSRIGRRRREMSDARVEQLAAMLHPRLFRRGGQVQMSTAAGKESLCAPHVEARIPTGKKVEVSDRRAEQILNEMYPHRRR